LHTYWLVGAANAGVRSPPALGAVPRRSCSSRQGWRNEASQRRLSAVLPDMLIPACLVCKVHCLCRCRSVAGFTVSGWGQPGGGACHPDRGCRLRFEASPSGLGGPAVHAGQVALQRKLGVFCLNCPLRTEIGHSSDRLQAPTLSGPNSFRMFVCNLPNRDHSGDGPRSNRAINMSPPHSSGRTTETAPRTKFEVAA